MSYVRGPTRRQAKLEEEERKKDPEYAKKLEEEKEAEENAPRSISGRTYQAAVSYSDRLKCDACKKVVGVGQLIVGNNTVKTISRQYDEDAKPWRKQINYTKWKHCDCFTMPAFVARQMRLQDFGGWEKLTDAQQSQLKKLIPLTEDEVRGLHAAFLDHFPLALVEIMLGYVEEYSRYPVVDPGEPLRMPDDEEGNEGDNSAEEDDAPKAKKKAKTGGGTTQPKTAAKGKAKAKAAAAEPAAMKKAKPKPKSTGGKKRKRGQDGGSDGDNDGENDSGDSGGGGDIGEEAGAGGDDKDFSKMTVPQLKVELKARGLPVSGTKAVLLKRLKK